MQDQSDYGTGMQESFELFDIAESSTDDPPPPVISEDQVRQLRSAFDEAGITGVKERRELVESCTVRSVASIRELLAKDFRPILKRIRERTVGATARIGSAWDNREEDTWIDKL